MHNIILYSLMSGVECHFCLLYVLVFGGGGGGGGCILFFFLFISFSLSFSLFLSYFPYAVMNDVYVFIP